MTRNDHAGVGAAYDRLAEDYAAHFPGTGPEAPIDLAVLDQLVALLGRSPVVLDAGCGTGRISRYLADRGCAVRGVDLSGGMLRMAQRDHPDIATTVGSITDLPYDDLSFDALVYWYSIIHLPDEALPRVFSEAARVLRPGGLAVVAFQAGDGVRDIGAGLHPLGHGVRLDRYHRQLDVVLAIAAAHGLFPLLQLTREPIGDEQDPQSSTILRSAG